MDTPFLCVYNPDRRVFLSSKVTVADAVNQPLKVLKDLVALETGSSGLWLNPLHHRPSLPKLFPYDLAYLDKDLRIVEMMEVIPGIELPEYRREVTSAVVLPPETFRSSQTRVGDQLIVCPKEEIVGTVELGAGSVEGPVAPQAEAPAPVPQGEAQPAAGAELGLAAKSTSNSLSPLTAAAAAPTDAPALKKADVGGVKTPEVSITEVVIERPHNPTAQTKQNVEHGSGLEDLFANWVDSPSAPPSWIAQKARERESDGLPETKRSERTPSDESGKEEEAAQETTKQPVRAATPSAKEPTPAQPPPTSVSPPPAAPGRSVPVHIPQRAQTTTFTIGQHGIWQLSTPTAITLPKRPASTGERPASTGVDQVPPKAASGNKRSGSSKADTQKPTTRAGADRAPAAQSAPPADVAPVRKPASAPEGSRPAENAHAIAREIKERAPHPAPPVASIEVGRPKVEFVASPAPAPASHQSKRPEPEKRRDPVEAEAEKELCAKQAHTGPQTGVADFAARIQEKLDRLQTPAAVPSSASARQIPPAEKKLSEPGPQPAVEARPPASSTQKPVARRETKAVPEQPRERAGTLPLPSFLRPKPQQKGVLNSPVQRKVANGKKDAASQPGLGERLKRWLSPSPSTKSDRRRALRRYVPGMVAHYYTGGAPKPHDVADISMSGFYLLTDEHWVPETMIRMTLQKPCARGERKQSITVLARIVRRGSDGIAAEFVMPESIDPNSRDVLPAQATDRFSLARFL